MVRYGVAVTRNNLINEMGLDSARAEKVWRLARGDLNPLDHEGDFPATCLWVKSCYHMPKRWEVAMAAIDEVIGTHGVEFIGGEFDAPEGEYSGPSFEYCNTGDTYDATIVRIDGEYRISSWGDIVERYS